MAALNRELLYEGSVNMWSARCNITNFDRKIEKGSFILMLVNIIVGLFSLDNRKIYRWI